MPVSGLVVTLDPGADPRRFVRDARVDGATIEFGEAEGQKIPAALDAKDREAERAALESLRRHRSVAHVDVVFVEVVESREATEESR